MNSRAPFSPAENDAQAVCLNERVGKVIFRQAVSISRYFSVNSYQLLTMRHLLIDGIRIGRV